MTNISFLYKKWCSNNIAKEVVRLYRYMAKCLPSLVSADLVRLHKVKESARIKCTVADVFLRLLQNYKTSYIELKLHFENKAKYDSET